MLNMLYLALFGLMSFNTARCADEPVNCVDLAKHIKKRVAKANIEVFTKKRFFGSDELFMRGSYVVGGVFSDRYQYYQKRCDDISAVGPFDGPLNDLLYWRRVIEEFSKALKHCAETCSESEVLIMLRKLEDSEQKFQQCIALQRNAFQEARARREADSNTKRAIEKYIEEHGK